MDKMNTAAKNSPIAHMWDCPMPRPDVEGAGFPILKNAAHTAIFTATRETGAYNHHSQLVRHNGLFHAMWSNHPHGEDGPGQRILYTASSDGASWPAPRELFPPPGSIKPSEETGLACTALRWLALDNNLYAVAGLHRNIGFTDHNEKLPPAPKRDKQHPARAREGYAFLARSLSAAGTFGPIFAGGAKIPGDLTVKPALDPTMGRFLRTLFNGKRGYMAFFRCSSGYGNRHR